MTKPTTQNRSGPKVSLVLGAGASRGWAHIGAIEALLDNNIPIHMVSGCSVGAFIGAVFASGGLDRVKEYVLEMDGESMFSLSDLSLLRSGMLDGDKKLRELFCMHTDKKEFSQLELPLKVMTVDMETGDPVVLDTGDLFTALRASMSYPGIFSPVYHKGRWLIDGGVVDPVPVGVARAMGSDIVIAVNLDSRLISRKRHWKVEPVHGDEQVTGGNEFLKNLAKRYGAAEKMFRERFEARKKLKPPKPPGTRQVINSAIEIMQKRITRVNFAVSPPDILITPRLGDLKLLDYDQVAHSIEEGYVATRNAVNDIKMLMGQMP
jgi:NTE family protein